MPGLVAPSLKLVSDWRGLGVTEGISSPEPPRAHSVLQPPDAVASSAPWVIGAVSGPPSILPGPSGATLVLVGYAHNVTAFLVGCLVTIEAYLPGRWYYWGGPIVVVVFTILSVGLIKTVRGYRKLAAEKRRGYTTVLGDAIDDPTLYYVDRKSLRVVSAPYAPRPRKRNETRVDRAGGHPL